MKIKKLISLALSGIMVFSIGTTAFASEMQELQAEKAAAEAQYAQTQGGISDLESKKQELENYLAQLNAQYEELTESVAELGVQAAEKEEELKTIQADLEKARAAAEKQYEAMKIRIAYMYERGGSNMLEVLLSSQSLAEFLNRASNVAEISEYDRNMLRKYEDLLQQIDSQEEAMEEEVSSINALLSERSEKKQEVQSLTASTNESISSYVAQISASQAEADALMAEIANADSSIASLVQQAAAQEAAAQESQEEDYGYDPAEDTTESYSSSTSSEVVVESVDEGYEAAYSSEAYAEAYSSEVYAESYSESYAEEAYAEESYTEESYEEEYYEEESYEETSSNSGSGTYLGNFTLTAYCGCAQCCGTAGNLTASGTVPSQGRTVAMGGVAFGTQLSINGNIYTVEDTGTPYGHVDIYFDSHDAALSFGLQYADVYQVG